NVKAALSLGHARGVALLSASMAGLPVFEYTPLEVKKALTGYGRAEKAQVMAMIKAILNINAPMSPDSSDALALALTHLNMELYGIAKH
ncbi:MAG: crossover junction endodeoxyribonuclease RuvC, partial [Candidatus Magnetominusculus sp. LBB02]|nr:crossover junction endodeoxyribonuclease RuvC [Candidatus Magnetominusculus sp. LBB02]